MVRGPHANELARRAPNQAWTLLAQSRMKGLLVCLLALMLVADLIGFVAIMAGLFRKTKRHR